MRPRLVLTLLFALAACKSPCGGPWYTDTDGDGTPDIWDDDADGDGWRTDQGDCDDCDPSRGPNFPDTSPDGVDQDCDQHDGSLRVAPEPPGLSTDALGAWTRDGAQDWAADSFATSPLGRL